MDSGEKTDKERREEKKEREKRGAAPTPLSKERRSPGRQDPRIAHSASQTDSHNRRAGGARKRIGVVSR